MTSPGPASSQVIELARSVRFELGRPDSYDHPTTARVRELYADAMSELVGLHSAEQRRLGRSDDVELKVLGIRPEHLRRVAPIDRTSHDREHLLTGGLMNISRESAAVLLNLVIPPYLLSAEASATWRRAGVAFEGGHILRPNSLSGAEGGFSRNDLVRLHEKHAGLSPDLLFENGQAAMSIGLHRHAYVTTGYLERVARDFARSDPAWLTKCMEMVRTIDAAGDLIERASGQIGAWRQAAQRHEPLSAVRKAIHDQDQQGEADQVEGAAAESAPGGGGAKPTPKRTAGKPRRKS